MVFVLYKKKLRTMVLENKTKHWGKKGGESEKKKNAYKSTPRILQLKWGQVSPNKSKEC